MFVITIYWCRDIWGRLHADLAVMRNRGYIVLKSVILFFWTLTILLLVVFAKVALLFVSEVCDAVRLL